MQKMLAAFVCWGAILCGSLTAHATDSAVQISVKGSEALWKYTHTPAVDGAISMFGNVNWTVNTGSALVFGYVGLDWTFHKEIRIRLYSGAMATSAGTSSVIASLWLEFLQLGAEDLSLCLQFDTYFPQHNKKPDGSDRISFYGQVVLNFKVGTDVTLSLFSELVADTNDVYELATGPLLRGKIVGLWLGFDLTPNVPGSWRFFTRVNLYLWK